MNRKFIHIFLFNLFFILSLIGFYGLNKNRALEKELLAEKVFSSYIETLAKGISQGYFVWDEMYKAILENDQEFFNKEGEDAKSIFPFILDAKIIEKDFNGEFEYLISADKEGLSFSFGIFNSGSEFYIKDKVVNVLVDTNKILNQLGFEKDFNMIISNDKGINEIKFIYAKPTLRFFHFISALAIGLLSIYIYQLLRKFFIKNHYEVEGLQAIIKILSKKDDYTAKHSQEVADIALKIAKELKIPRKQSKKLYKAALLHDIGKIGISEQILNKLEKLTNEEFSLIKKHPEYSYDIVSQFPNLREVADIVRYHHEMMDGSGYLKGLKGEEIPFLSQVLAVSDVFNALTTDRPYRKKLTKEKALKIMKEMPLNQDLVKILESIIENERNFSISN